jgi:hypothetical protein
VTVGIDQQGRVYIVCVCRSDCRAPAR